MFRYKAFISYSHRDSRAAARLMRKLEAFLLPRHVDVAATVPRRHPRALGKFFRDREELPATDCMDAKIREALRASEYLIVICSEASAGSPRVAAEIRDFAAHRDPAKILCFIISGEPHADTTDMTDAADGCFNKALVELLATTGRVPLAADARPHGDGATAAFRKLVAGLVNIDLDILVQRENRRRQHRMLVVTAASVSIAMLTTGLMFRADSARDEAQAARLEAQRQQERAETLAEFMIEDLVGTELQKQGRIEAIDAVVAKVVDHYSSQDDADLSPAALSRKSRAYMQLARLYLDRREWESAHELLDYARSTTAALVAKDPDNPRSITNHSRTLHWLGTLHIFRGQYSEAERIWQNRLAIGAPLMRREDLDEISAIEVGHMNIHLGWVLMELGRTEEALEQFQDGVSFRKSLIDRFPGTNRGMRNNYAGGLYHLSWAQEFLPNGKVALETAAQSNREYGAAWEAEPTNMRALSNLGRSHRWFAERQLWAGLNQEAVANLRQSINFLERAQESEPANDGYRLQACYSTILMAEALLRSDGAADIDALLEVHCPDYEDHIGLDTPYIHTRMFGYHLALLRIEDQVGGGILVEARDARDGLAERFLSERDEVRRSVRGTRVHARLALAAAEIEMLSTGTRGSATEALSALVDHLRSGGYQNHPETRRLISAAEQLVSATNLAR